MSNKQNDNFADFVAEMFIDDGFSPKEATEMAYFAIDNDLKGKDEILDEWQKAKPQIRLDQEKDRTDAQAREEIN